MSVNYTNKRRFFRLSFSNLLCAEMKLIPLEDIALKSRIWTIGIMDISGGGLRFLSPVKLPVEYRFLVEFKMSVLNEEYKLLGEIIRSSETERYEYAVRFISDDATQSKLVQMVNLLSVKFRKNVNLTSCNFCTDEQLQVLLGKTGSNRM